MPTPTGASLKHVNLSQQGNDTAVQPDFAERTDFTAPNKAESGKNVIFKLAGSISRSVRIDGIQDVINPKTKKKDRMRLLRGVSEIWMRDQKEIDKEYAQKNRVSLHFIDGVCILDSVRDAPQIEFARLTNNFIDNPFKITGAKRPFYEWNPAEQEREALEKEELENEVVQLAMAQPFEKLRKHAAFLGGISFFDEMGEPRTEKGVRTLYIRRAKQDPKRFKATLDSKEVEINYLIRKAITEAKIDIGQKGKISWAGGGLITPLPAGRQAHEYLLELALLPTEEGKDFLERLQKTAI